MTTGTPPQQPIHFPFTFIGHVAHVANLADFNSSLAIISLPNIGAATGFRRVRTILIMVFGSIHVRQVTNLM